MVTIESGPIRAYYNVRTNVPQDLTVEDGNGKKSKVFIPKGAIIANVHFFPTGWSVHKRKYTERERLRFALELSRHIGLFAAALTQQDPPIDYIDGETNKGMIDMALQRLGFRQVITASGNPTRRIIARTEDFIAAAQRYRRD
jgi:hypothetical protein